MYPKKGDLGNMNVDTNIVIAYLADDQDVVHFIDELKANKVKLFISSIVEAELISQGSLTVSEISSIFDFISDYFIVIPLDRYTLKSTAYFRRKYAKIKIADACVLGVSKLYDLELITRDKELLKITEITTYNI